ncbi:MAG TPA: hypothetical protein DD990_07505 [Cyanobacteria bacterium UBA11368]|nr:hypothetical protein [Cyanobacteria bacterium UBA11368]
MTINYIIGIFKTLNRIIEVIQKSHPVGVEQGILGRVGIKYIEAVLNFDVTIKQNIANSCGQIVDIL